jgi:hypothetical protein
MQYTAILAIALLMAAPALAFASEVEIVEVDRKSAVIFLLDKACKPNIYADYVERFPQAWVVCTDYSDWKDARANLYGFEALYHTIYVTQENQHEKASEGVKGQAWFRDGNNYAYAINNPIAIAHELSHLECACHFTPDGLHDSDKELYPWLWKAEWG